MKVFFLSLFLLLPTALLAETIVVPIGQQGMDKVNMERPAKGMTAEQVVAMFGEPLSWTEAVGIPPISRWVYTDYVVYFESDYVIHTVMNPKESAE